jgi:hypothetical protein
VDTSRGMKVVPASRAGGTGQGWDMRRLDWFDRTVGTDLRNSQWGGLGPAIMNARTYSCTV